MRRIWRKYASSEDFRVPEGTEEALKKAIVARHVVPSARRPKNPNEWAVSAVKLEDMNFGGEMSLMHALQLMWFKHCWGTAARENKRQKAGATITSAYGTRKSCTCTRVCTCSLQSAAVGIRSMHLQPDFAWDREKSSSDLDLELIKEFLGAIERVLSSRLFRRFLVAQHLADRAGLRKGALLARPRGNELFRYWDRYQEENLGNRAGKDSLSAVMFAYDFFLGYVRDQIRKLNVSEEGRVRLAKSVIEKTEAERERLRLRSERLEHDRHLLQAHEDRQIQWWEKRLAHQREEARLLEEAKKEREVEDQKIDRIPHAQSLRAAETARSQGLPDMKPVSEDRRRGASGFSATEFRCPQLQARILRAPMEAVFFDVFNCARVRQIHRAPGLKPLVELEVLMKIWAVVKQEAVHDARNIVPIFVLFRDTYDELLRQHTVLQTLLDGPGGRVSSDLHFDDVRKQRARENLALFFEDFEASKA